MLVHYGSHLLSHSTDLSDLKNLTDKLVNLTHLIGMGRLSSAMSSIAGSKSNVCSRTRYHALLISQLN